VPLIVLALGVIMLAFGLELQPGDFRRGCPPAVRRRSLSALIGQFSP